MTTVGKFRGCWLTSFRSVGSDLTLKCLIRRAEARNPERSPTDVHSTHWPLPHADDSFIFLFLIAHPTLSQPETSSQATFSMRKV